MKRTLDVEICLAEARRLTRVADAATDYETILTYDLLAMEWVELAARCMRASGPAPLAKPDAQPPASPARRKWFRFL